jgi:hypothetical protein
VSRTMMWIIPVLALISCVIITIGFATGFPKE